MIKKYFRSSTPQNGTKLILIINKILQPKKNISWNGIFFVSLIELRDVN